jgi:hypothetical protein
VSCAQRLDLASDKPAPNCVGESLTSRCAARENHVRQELVLDRVESEPDDLQLALEQQKDRAPSLPPRLLELSHAELGKGNSMRNFAPPITNPITAIDRSSSVAIIVCDAPLRERSASISARERSTGTLVPDA